MKNINTCISIVFLVAMAMACSGECKYKVFGEKQNASGSHRVVRFYNWCGYTSSNNINLSLLGKGDSIENRTRIFFVAASQVGSDLNRDTTITFNWINDSTIAVAYSKSAVIIQKDDRKGDIVVKYTER